MSGRPQGRGRQTRRDRSQRNKGRDNSADSVGSTTSTQSERERDREREQRNGRNNRRRPEKKDERGKRRNDETRRDVSDREGSKVSAAEKDKGKPRSEPEKPPRGRGEPSRDPARELNRDSFPSKGSANERNNMFGDDSRLSLLVKRITKESERERRLTAAQQFEEFLNTPDNYQIVDKHADNLFSALEDVLFERGQPELKEKIAMCVGLIGGILGNEAGRFFQWIFTKLESSVSDEVKILLLTALSKAIQVDTKNKCFRDFMMNVMSSLQNILENVDTSDLLRAALNVMMPIAIDYPHAFAGHFRDTVDILVGWHIDTSQQNSLTSYTSECLVKLHDYWASDIAFSLTLLSQFLEDMEAYAEELSMLSSNQDISSEEIPSPYVSLPRLTALVRVFTTVVNGIGPSFSPNRSPSITPPYLTELIQRIIHCINMSGYSYYYEKLFVSANKCLESMCSWLQPYFSCCCEITASFVIQQLQSSSCVTYPHIMSALQLIQKVIAHVNTAIPAAFIEQLLGSGSPVMKLRLSSDQAVLSLVMKIYQGFLGIHDVPLLETAYKIAVTELIDSFSLLQKTLQPLEANNSKSELQLSNNNKEETTDDLDRDLQSETVDVEKNTPVSNLVQWRSAYELESIVIFDLCALSEIATSKSAILRLWKLSPSPYQLLTQHLDACEWRLAVCYPSVQYTILHALYTYCQRYNHFLPNSPSEGLCTSQDGDVVSMFSLLSKVLGNSSTSQDSRKLCLVWLVEVLDKAIKTGVLVAVSKHVSLDSLAQSILPSSFDHNPTISLEVSLFLNILVDLKALSTKCLRKFLEDCAVRLMDVNKEVCKSYQQLIKALPTDILTSSISQSLFESRTSQARASVDVGKPLITSCSDVWLARKGHAVKPPSLSFHSHDFQMVMGFILSGVSPSKEANVEWLLRLFHSCNRVQKYAESEMVQFNRCESLLWFWATWEAAQFCILSRLRTPLGRAQETFQAIEGALQKFVMDANGKEEESKPKHEEAGAKEEEGNETVAESKPYVNHLQSVLLLQFIENLEKLMYNGYEGCVVGLPSPPKSVRVFFRTNRSTCIEWLTRVRKPVMTVALVCGCPAATVWHGFQMLQEMKTAGNTQGEEFDSAALLTAQALCELRSAHAITGLIAWCEQVSGQKFTWMNGTMMKAKGWYESSTTENKSAVEEMVTKEKSHQEERKTSDAPPPCTAVTTFLVNEVADCYMKLSSWTEVAEWQKHVNNLRKQCSDSAVQHSLMANVDMNHVKALSKFEECDFISVRNHLRLIPGAALNSLTENLTKSAWSVKLNHPDTTFTPVWAPYKIEQTAELSLIQAQTLFFTSGNLKAKSKDNNSKDQKIIQAIKECIHHATSLCEGVLRVGTLGWPLEVSASHMTQLQFASTVENVMETALHQEDVSSSFLQGNGTFTVNHTQHDCAVLIKALRFCANLHYVASSVGKHQDNMKSELVSLQLATAKLARKHHNFSLAQRLLVKQVSLLGNAVKIPQDSNCSKKQFLEPLMESLNDASLATAKPVDVMEIQRECSKLAFALDHSSEAVYYLSDSISQYSNLGDIDSSVGAINSRSLLTLAKWLLNDRKLLTAVTKINGNGLAVAAKISSLCELEANYVSLGHSTLIPAQDDSPESNLNSTSVPSVACGVTDAESVCGQLLHLATMQAPDLGKVWFNLAGWCYRWGRKTVEQASSMGNVDLLPQEKETVSQNLPQSARPAEVESVELVLGQVHVTAYFNQDEDIGEEDQLYDDGVENTKKQLVTVCPGLQDAQPQLLENLLCVWKGVRDRLFKHYHFAAKAYFMYLRMGNVDCDRSSDPLKNDNDKTNGSKNSDDDSNVTATLRLLRLLVKHAGELRSELEEGLVKTPTRPWKDITPQLFSRLNHPESYVRQSVSELLCRVGQDAPHLIVYPAVVGCSTSLPKYLLNKGKEGEGLLPLLVSSSTDSAENSQNQGSQPCEVQGSKTESDALTSCYQTIVESIRTHNPQLVSDLQGFIMELRRITLLWEELWHGSLMQTHHDVTRRQQQLEDEIKRVNGNQNLTNQQKATLIREKHIAIMKPVVFAIEQLNKITSQETATSHEQWFQMTYSGAIKAALEALQNPPDPSDHRSSWEPFKQLLQAFQARSQKRSAYTLYMDEISPSLASLKASAVYMPGQTHFSGKIVTIDSVIREVNILPTKTKPKKLVFVGSDGQRYTYLFKGLEDLHLDERIMQFLSICNNMFARFDSHNSPQFCARHYSVTPLGPRSGLIQWVDGAVPVFALFKRWQQREGTAIALVKSAQGANQPAPPTMKPSELYYSKITPALKEKGITDLSNRKDWPLGVMKNVLEELMKETPNDLLAKELWCSSTSAAEWWQMTQSYARSTAVMSMIGYIIGLGDRHLDNMLVDFTTGEVVHIDYNVCFEKGKGLRVPEKVPFRMTPNLETALGVTGVEGVFRLSCEEVLKILKQGRETLLTLLEAFVYDPLVDWTTANDTAFASAFYGGGAPGVTDNKVNKKEMERDVTQSLFSSRVAEMKVTWTNNRDELLSGMTKLDEQLDTYLASLKQLKSLDLSTDELKDQQETLQAAIGNPQHPLHTVQAKFDEKKKLLADHDAVLQATAEKLLECQQWQVQHKAAMETVHGPKLGSLVGELLQPLDLGLPSFAPAISFLKGAGQGHIVNQCEQLETELSGLLHQRRTMFRSCLDLLHTYATVTSLFPSDYVQQNRSFEWQSWLQSLVDDSSTKRCQDVLEESEKLHNKPVADSPLTLAEVTGFMAMEVKLQSSLTEQNAKFIKFSERRKQESVETAFLSKAVGETYGALKKYITGKQPSSFRCLTSVLITALCSLNKRCLAMENTAKVAKDRLSELTSREGDWFLDELCSMSGNVNQLLLLLKDHPMEVKEDQKALLGQAQNSMKAVLAVQKVFMALQELMTNFRTIIVPEAVKSIYAEDPTVFAVVEQVQAVACSQKISLRELAESIEARLMEGHSAAQTLSAEEVDTAIREMHTRFEKILQTNKIAGSDSGEDTSNSMTSGQMLLAGFNGLFTKVASELTDMFTAFERVHFDQHDLKFDIVRDAQELQLTNVAKNADLLGKLFFLKRLEVITSFFQSCRLVTLSLKGESSSAAKPGVINCVAEPSNNLFTNSDTMDAETKTWNPDTCYSEDDLAVHVKHFIADCVQQCIMGLPSQALAAVVIAFANILGKKGDKESVNEEGVVSLEDYCKKVVDGNISSGIMKSKHLSQITSLTSSYDVAWRKHDFAKRLDNNMSIYKGVVQRAQLQLARFQWLYEDNLLRCPMRGSSMITPARATVMADLKKRVQGLIHMDSVVKGVEEKFSTQEASIEQRLKWAAGANPALNPVLQNFEKTLAARKKLMMVESKHSSDICNLSNAILHCEALRTHTADAVGIDNVMTALVKRCQHSSAELESCSEKLHDVTEVAKKVKVSYPPEAPITLDWMKNKLEAVGQEMQSIKTRKSQAAQAIMNNRDSIKAQASSVKSTMVSHQQLIGDVKSMLTTMAKDEEAAESRPAKLFISTHNRQSEECAQLIKSILAVCSGKISDGRENVEDNITEVKSMVKSIKSLVQWVHDHLLSLASPLVPDESGSSAGKTPIAAPPPTFASALRQGSNVVAAGGKDSVGPSDTGSTHPVILQRDIAASPSGACSPTASARLVAAASPRRISTTNVARDPRTGKALQERNTYAISVWRRVKSKLDGRDQDNKKMSVPDQVDFVIRESRSVDNLSQMYEGWTAWV